MWFKKKSNLLEVSFDAHNASGRDSGDGIKSEHVIRKPAKLK